jgi:O-antigen/teichoic acid export membrane protein
VILLSLVLVVVAAVTLIAGFFQEDSLALIYVSIGSCVAAMGALGVGVLQRRGRGGTTGPAPDPGARGDGGAAG